MFNSDYFCENTNPFLIDVEEKDFYTIEDHIKIQTKLLEHGKNIDEFMDSLYPDCGMRTSLSEMKRRCKKGLNAQIINISNPILPEIEMHKIGDGGNGKNCFVCCTPLSDDRFTASKTIIDSLIEVGFNGHFLLLNGGFPNPTGKEMKYVGVPYCFKIFMILEAKKRGFEKVIWIDAACYAVNNPDQLFEKMDTSEAIFRTFPPNCFAPETYNNICFPKTIELLNKLVNRDVRNDTTINSIVFGLNLSCNRINYFIDEYYKMVELGLPFLTAFPEEIVFSALMNKPECADILEKANSHNLYIHECYLNKENAKHAGYFFVQRGY